VPAPAELDDIGASAIWVSYLTAWGALVELGRLSKGDFVLISAASSSVGLAAIGVALSVGAIPIAVTRTSAKAQALIDAGAAHVIASAERDLGEALRGILGGKGLRLAFDPIAGPFAESLVPFMAEEGIIFIYGGLSDQPTLFDRRPILAKGLSMTGYTLGQILKHADRLERGFAFMRAGLAKGTVAPLVDRVFAFADVQNAHRYMEANQHIGKIVLSVP
jgi:NADPH:quinone reductase-like Zn-dependent oxidoreductase